LLTTRLARAFAVSAAIAAAAALAGLALSFKLDLPTGPFTVVLLAAIVPLAAVVKRIQRR